MGLITEPQYFVSNQILVNIYVWILNLSNLSDLDVLQEKKKTCKRKHSPPSGMA